MARIVRVPWHDEDTSVCQVVGSSRRFFTTASRGRVRYRRRPVTLLFDLDAHTAEECWLIAQMRRPAGLEIVGKTPDGARHLVTPGAWRSREHPNPADWLRRIVDPWLWGCPERRAPAGTLLTPARAPFACVLAERIWCPTETLVIDR